MSEELRNRIRQFHEEYLSAPAGQDHLATVEAEADEVKRVFNEIKLKSQSGQDITDNVLNRLLPHSDTTYHRENDYRISTWPCISKDVRKWFEGAGWKEPQDWEPTAVLLFEAINGVIDSDLEPWDLFLGSQYRRGFGTGFVSPILFCLDDQYPVINSKVVKTYRYCMDQLGEPDGIDARLDNYFENAEKVQQLQKRLEPFGLNNIAEFDIFCHFMVSKRLGGGDLTQPQSRKKEAEQYSAWLFVANPKIFLWQQAFDDNGVDWDGSKGTYPQKLLREQIRKGDQVFGYQAGPHYEICCELVASSQPYRTTGGTWAVDLSPVRWLNDPIPLSVLKAHPKLSNVKFIKQTQMSISGFTPEQLLSLESLIEEPAIQTTLSTVEKLCQELVEAQFDTTNHERFEAALADAFEFLGFETEHIGGAGNADVVVIGQLGSSSYRAIVDAKTRRQGSSLGQVYYHSILDHKEESSADYAIVVANTFSGGKTVEHALKENVGLLPTEVLISVLRQHEKFPFSLFELRRLFDIRGLATGVQKELARINLNHDNILQLINEVIQIFDDLQRQQDNSWPISSSSIALLMQQKATLEGAVPPKQQQIDSILSFLSNEAFGILAKESDGYVITLSTTSTRKRLEAVAAAI